jgi:hypothetical protein
MSRQLGQLNLLYVLHVVCAVKDRPHRLLVGGMGGWEKHFTLRQPAVAINVHPCTYNYFISNPQIGFYRYYITAAFACVTALFHADWPISAPTTR